MTDTFSRELLRQRVEQILAQPSFPLRYLPTLSGDARLKYPPQPTPRCYRGRIQLEQRCRLQFQDG
jgi:hypothetical protein